MNGGPAENAAGVELRKEGFVEEALPALDAVYRFALRLAAGDEDEARDLVQETFLRAYRSWESFTRGTNVRSWLFTICRNVFLRSREQRARRRETLPSQVDADLDALAATSSLEEGRPEDPEQAFYDSFVDAEVLAAVDRLPGEFREAVTLSDLHGLNYAETADVLGVPIGTVKSRLYRGRRLLEKALYEYAREMGYVKSERTRR